MQWFFADAQRVQHGPMGAADLVAAFQAGKFSAQDLVWREGMAEWRPFAQFATEFGLDEDDLYPGQAGNEMNLTQLSEPLRPRADDNPYAAPSAPLSDSVYAAMGDHEVVYAGFWKRFAALFLDNLILSVASYAILIPLVLLMGMGDLFTNPESAPELSPGQLGLVGLIYLIYPTLSFLYFCLLESGPAQASLGKRVVGIKVCTVQGQRMSFANAAGRWFATLLSYLTLYIGFAMAGFTERKQALHDMLASTLVVDQYAYTNQAHLQRRELGGCAITMIVLFGGLMLLMVLGIVLAIAIPAMAG